MHAAVCLSECRIDDLQVVPGSERLIRGQQRIYLTITLTVTSPRSGQWSVVARADRRARLPQSAHYERRPRTRADRLHYGLLTRRQSGLVSRPADRPGAGQRRFVNRRMSALAMRSHDSSAEFNK